jgi:hypothetical protein
MLLDSAPRPPPATSTKLCETRLCYFRFLVVFFADFFTFARVFDAFFAISTSPFCGTGMLNRQHHLLPLSIYH